MYKYIFNITAAFSGYKSARVEQSTACRFPQSAFPLLASGGEGSHHLLPLHDQGDYNPLQYNLYLLEGFFPKKKFSFDVIGVSKRSPTDLIYHLADRAESTRSPGGEDILLNHQCD